MPSEVDQDRTQFLGEVEPTAVENRAKGASACGDPPLFGNRGRPRRDPLYAGTCEEKEASEKKLESEVVGYVELRWILAKAVSPARFCCSLCSSGIPHAFRIVETEGGGRTRQVRCDLTSPRPGSRARGPHPFVLRRQPRLCLKQQVPPADQYQLMETPPEVPPRPKSDSPNVHTRNASSPAAGVPTSPSRTKLSAGRTTFTPPSSPPQRMERILSASALSNAGTSSTTHAPQPLPRSSLDLPPPNPRELLKLASGAVKSRTGSVLSRGYILKSDYRPPAPPSSAPGDEGSVGGGVHLRGAPGFRMAELGVYGVAQPTELGLRTVLSVLRSQPVVGPGGKGKGKGRETVWFCTREEPVVYIGSQPFVLRDAAHPTTTYSLSDRAENLEEIETRCALAWG